MTASEALVAFAVSVRRHQEAVKVREVVWEQAETAAAAVAVANADMREAAEQVDVARATLEKAVRAEVASGVGV